MKIWMVTFTLLISAWYDTVKGIPVNEIRNRFLSAADDSRLTRNLHAEIAKMNPLPGSIPFAYMGALETLMARHAYNPFSKLDYLEKGMEKINRSILMEPENVEFRFMRYNVESSSPSFLHKEIHLSEDKAKILYLLSHNNDNSELLPLKKHIASVMLASGKLNSREKVFLQTYLKTHI